MVPAPRLPGRSLLALTSPSARGLPGEAAPLKTQGISPRTTSWPLPLTLKRGSLGSQEATNLHPPTPLPQSKAPGGRHFLQAFLYSGLG